MKLKFAKRFTATLGLLAASALMFTAPSASAQVYSSCAQYGSWTSGIYTVYTDEWGASSGQCLSVYSAGNWTSASNFTGNGIKAYPNTSFTFNNVALSSLSSVPTTFSVTVPSSGAQYDVPYDIWSANDVDEIMIWEEWSSGSGPLSSKWDSSSNSWVYNYGCSSYPATACPIATNVTINGASYNVYQGNNGHNVISFLRNTQRASGSEDVLQFLNWAANNGYMVSKTLAQVEFGIEVTSTSGTQDFTLNSYSYTPSNYLIPNGTYVFKNKNSGMAIDDYGNSTSEGTLIDQWPANGGSNQNWTVNNLGNNYITLTNGKSGLLLDVRGASTSSGALIDQWPSNSGTNQAWKVVSEGSGYYELISEKSGLALGVPNSSTSEGTDLEQLTVTGAANQLWSF